MNDVVFTTIAVTGFTVAFLHAAIPTHWLPFVLTARVQKWNRSETVFVPNRETAKSPRAVNAGAFLLLSSSARIGNSETRFS